MKRILTVLAASCVCAAAVMAADVDSYVGGKYNGSTESVQSSWGALNCHDPKIFQDDDGTYYVYSTDASIGNVHKNGLQVRTSDDLVHWQCLGTSALQDNWDKDFVSWVGQNVFAGTTWAPTVMKQNGLYYMFHGIITDAVTRGEPTACITLAVASVPEGPFYPASQAAKKDPAIADALSKAGVSYKQSSLVRYSYLGSNTLNSGNGTWAEGFGAIDPEFVTDVSDGSMVKFTIGGNECYGITYGSWKGGIALMYVDAVSLKPVGPDGTELDAPADTVEGAYGTLVGGGYGAAYEGSQIIYNKNTGYYYLFVSMGDLNNDYRVGMGRSKDVTGPYIDAGGKNMKFDKPWLSADFHAIGSKIIGAYQLKDELGWRCQGGQSILRTDDGKIIFACHSRTNFQPGYYFYLQIHQMFFTPDGWPVLNMNEYYNDYDGKDEQLAKLSIKDIAGTYDAVVTVRGSDSRIYTPYGGASVNCNAYDAPPTESQEAALNADGSVSGKKLNGTWKLGADGYTVTFDLGKSGKFTGYALRAVDWSRKGNADRRTVTFTAISGGDGGSGEYFFGNRRAGK
jgi:arabinan endo-1,5-alpha-L-arabinosidase